MTNLLIEIFVHLLIVAGVTALIISLILLYGTRRRKDDYLSKRNNPDS